MKARVSIFLVTASVIVVVWTEVTHACAMCQTVMPRGDNPLARGFFVSMLILLAAPFVVSAAIGGWLYYCQRVGRSAARGPSETGVPFPQRSSEKPRYTVTASPFDWAQDKLREAIFGKLP